MTEFHESSCSTSASLVINCSLSTYQDFSFRRQAVDFSRLPALRMTHPIGDQDPANT